MIRTVGIEGIELNGPSSSKKPTDVKAGGFGEKLKEAIADVNTLQHDADLSMERVAKGTLGIHEGMLAITKADLSLRLLVQVRNKVLDAYKEISRM